MNIFVTFLRTREVKIDEPTVPPLMRQLFLQSEKTRMGLGVFSQTKTPNQLFAVIFGESN